MTSKLDLAEISQIIERHVQNINASKPPIEKCSLHEIIKEKFGNIVWINSRNGLYTYYRSSDENRYFLIVYRNSDCYEFNDFLYSKEEFIKILNLLIFA